MFRTIDDFLKVWDYETQSTLKVIRSASPAALGQRVTAGGRSFAFLAWHRAQTIPELGGGAGLEVPGPGEKDAAPSALPELASAYAAAAQGLVRSLRST